jgi:hypothetical protein
MIDEQTNLSSNRKRFGILHKINNLENLTNFRLDYFYNRKQWVNFLEKSFEIQHQGSVLRTDCACQFHGIDWKKPI